MSNLVANCSFVCAPKELLHHMPASPIESTESTIFRVLSDGNRRFDLDVKCWPPHLLLRYKWFRTACGSPFLFKSQRTWKSGHKKKKRNVKKNKNLSFFLLFMTYKTLIPDWGWRWSISFSFLFVSLLFYFAAAAVHQQKRKGIGLPAIQEPFLISIGVGAKQERDEALGPAKPRKDSSIQSRQ